MKAEYLDHMGTDLDIANAARVSFANESRMFTFRADVAKGSDEGLIQYLAKHKHWTPFAHTAIKLRVSAPVPIRTQCFKHKAGFVENEESRRYISSIPELYVPDHFRRKPEGSVKQGSGGEHEASRFWLPAYVEQCRAAIKFYEQMIADGICPEQARFVLPQGVLVNWIWTGNLMSFARFYTQRTDPHAQQEVRDLATKIGALIEPLFPVSWKALTDAA